MYGLHRFRAGPPDAGTPGRAGTARRTRSWTRRRGQTPDQLFPPRTGSEAKRHSSRWPESHHCKPAAANASTASTAAATGLIRALHTIAIARIRCHAETRAYEARRSLRGKTHRDIRGCLKHSLARHLYLCPRSRGGMSPGSLDKLTNMEASNGLLRQCFPKDTAL